MDEHVSKESMISRQWSTFAAAVVVACCVAVLVWWITAEPGSPARGIASEVSDAIPLPGASADDVVVRVPVDAGTTESVARHAESPAVMRIVVLANGATSPVPGASVYVAADGSGAIFDRVVTAEDGVCELPVEPRLARRAVAVDAPGFGAKLVTMDTAPGLERVVEVSPARAIAGTITAIDGGALPADLFVFAWPSYLSPTSRLMRASRNGFPAVLSARVDTTGRFEIGNADPATTYVVGAGAEGWATLDLPRLAAGSDAPIQLEVAPIYGCRLAIELPGGDRPPHVPGATWTAAEPPGAARLSHPSTSLDLAGCGPLPGALVDGVYDWRASLVACAADRRGESLGPMSATYRVPGFEVVEVALSLPRLGDPVAVHRAEIRPSAAGFGSLRIEFLGGAEVPAPDTTLATLDVALTSLDGFTNIKTPVRSLDAAVHIEGVPVGEYRVFVFSDFHGRIPVWDAMKPYVRIVKGGAATHRVDCSGLGAAVFEPEDPMNAWRDPAVSLMFPPFERVAVRFRGPPYVLQGLRPGRHDVRLIRSGPGGAEVVDVYQVVVSGGSLTEVGFTW